MDEHFEEGAISALDGVDVICNPYKLGTEAYDDWESGWYSVDGCEPETYIVPEE